MSGVVPRLDPSALDDLDLHLAPADAARYPGDTGARQPVHTGCAWSSARRRTGRPAGRVRRP